MSSNFPPSSLTKYHEDALVTESDTMTASLSCQFSWRDLGNHRKTLVTTAISSVVTCRHISKTSSVAKRIAGGHGWDRSLLFTTVFTPFLGSHIPYAVYLGEIPPGTTLRKHLSFHLVASCISYYSPIKNTQ